MFKVNTKDTRFLWSNRAPTARMDIVDPRYKMLLHSSFFTNGQYWVFALLSLRH